MSAKPSADWSATAIRLVAVGVGTVVAGPLGAALGAFGALFSEQAASLLKEYAKPASDALSEFAVKYCNSRLREKHEYSPLEAVVRESLRLGLGDVRDGLGYDDWFDDWDARLKESRPLRLASLERPMNGTDFVGGLFQEAMERLDAEARAKRTLSITSRTMPEDLLRSLTERLPVPLDRRFRDLVALPENSRAWIAVQQDFHDYARSQFHALRSDTTRILDILENQLTRAKEEGRLSREDEIQAERAKAQEWEEKYRKLEADAAARAAAHKAEPGEDSFAALLAAGDLDGAVRIKTEQIEKRKPAIKEQARNYAELGRVHDLRFAWREAMECYRQAWRLDPGEAEYGFHYAYFAQEQNRFADAIEAYEQVRLLCTDSAQFATTLNNLAILYSATQRMKEAESAYQEALKTYRALAERNPEAYLPDVARTLNNLAVLYRATQRMKEAESAYQEALKTYRKLERNPEAYLPDVAGTLNNLAALYSDTQRMKEAESSYQEALKTYHALAGHNPEAYLPDVAGTLNNLANLYSDTQRMKKAESSYQEALKTYRKLERNPEAYLPDVARTLNNLANLYRATQRIKEAESVCQEAQTILDPFWRFQPEVHGDKMARILLLRAILIGPKRPTEACEFARQALDTAYDPSVKQVARELMDLLT